MRCVDFEARLNDVLDERAAPESDPELVRHSQTCVNCAEQMQWHLQILSAVHPPVMPNSIADRIATPSPVARGLGRLMQQPAFWGGIVVAAAVGWLAINLPKSAPQPANTGDSAAELADRSPSAGPSPLVASQQFYSLLEQLPVEETKRVAEPIAGGIRPIRNSLGVAFDALRETLPPNKRPEEGPQANSTVVVPVSV